MDIGLKSVRHQWGSYNNESDALLLAIGLMNNLLGSCNEMKKNPVSKEMCMIPAKK